MELRAADPASERGSDRDLAVVASARALAVLSELRTDLVETLGAEAEKLYLRHRHHPRQGEAERRADDAGLGQRSVDDPIATEAIDEPARRPKDAAQLAHIEPEQHYARVALHLLAEGVVDRLDDVALGHLPLPVQQLSALPENAFGWRLINIVEEVLGARDRSRCSGRQGRVDLTAELFGHACLPALIPEGQACQVFLDPLDWVLLAGLLVLHRVLVKRWVVGGVVEAHAVGHRLAEGRAFTRSSLLDRANHNVIDGHHVIAVHLDALKAVAGRPQREARGGRLDSPRGRDCPRVVLHEEDPRRLG